MYIYKQIYIYIYIHTCIYIYIYTHAHMYTYFSWQYVCVCVRVCVRVCSHWLGMHTRSLSLLLSLARARFIGTGWLRLVGSLKLQVPFAKKPYKRDYILQKRPIILRSLLLIATPYWSNLISECRMMYDSSHTLWDSYWDISCLMKSYSVSHHVWDESHMMRYTIRFHKAHLVMSLNVWLTSCHMRFLLRYRIPHSVSLHIWDEIDIVCRRRFGCRQSIIA